MSEKQVTFSEAMASVSTNLTRISVQLADYTAEANKAFDALQSEIAELKMKLAEKNQPVDDDIK
jgi:hypothetical protein